MALVTAIRTGRAKISGRGVQQSELVTLIKALRSTVLWNPTLAANGTPNASYQHSAFDYRVDGQCYTKAAATNVAITGQGLPNTAAGQFYKVRIEVRDVAGTPTLSYVAGGIYASQEEARVPPRTSGRATVGIIEIPASFTVGTTNITTAMLFGGDPDLNQLGLDS